MSKQDPLDRYFLPNPDEYAPYYGSYVEAVLGEFSDPVAGLRAGLLNVVALLQEVDEERGAYRYAEGKWSIKEVLLHLIDAERVFAYRALRIARGDRTSLAGFDQDAYVPESGAAARSLSSILEEYLAVRNASIQLFENLPNHSWTKMGEASGNPVSVRALAYILLGHERSHLKTIKERYLA